jgi:hypothetical protein
MPITRSATKRNRLHRRIAAMLAGAAILVMPVQVLAECSMLDATTVGSQVASEHADHAQHAGHEQPGGSGESPMPTDHAPCPELAHCTAIAVSVESPPRAAERVAHAAVAARPMQAPTPPTRAVEPPPPKR